MSNEKRNGKKRDIAAKDYSKPRLVTYGDLRKITQGVGGVQKDGAIKPSTKAVSTP